MYIVCVIFFSCCNISPQNNKKKKRETKDQRKKRVINSSNAINSNESYEKEMTITTYRPKNYQNRWKEQNFLKAIEVKHLLVSFFYKQFKINLLLFFYLKLQELAYHKATNSGAIVSQVMEPQMKTKNIYKTLKQILLAYLGNSIQMNNLFLQKHTVLKSIYSFENQKTGYLNICSNVESFCRDYNRNKLKRLIHFEE
ncbi:hypothetical protein RFI_03208, partial [Reticulomyxa filosa]